MLSGQLTAILLAMTLAEAIDTRRIIASPASQATALRSSRPACVAPPSDDPGYGADWRGSRTDAGRHVAGPPRRALPG